MYCDNCGRLLQEDAQFCAFCGTKIEGYDALLHGNTNDAVSIPSVKETKKKPLVALTILLIAAVIACGVMTYLWLDASERCNTYQTNYKEKNNSYTELSKKYDTLLRKYNRMEPIASFYLDYAGITEGEGGNGLYHRFGCPDIQASEFYIFNKEYAEANGFSPCPKCFSENGDTYLIDYLDE